MPAEHEPPTTGDDGLLIVGLDTTTNRLVQIRDQPLALYTPTMSPEDLNATSQDPVLRSARIAEPTEVTLYPLLSFGERSLITFPEIAVVDDE